MKLRHQVWPLICLGVVFVIAIALRLYRIDQSPKGALIDEAHFGYLAKSLLMTGKDEHSKSWPIIFTGFGDQKLPGYAYVLIPFVAAFDLSVKTIRLPSVWFGSLSVLLMYVLARKVGFKSWSALIGATIFAFSPWSFFLSRFGFESNLALFFWLLGLIGLVSVLKSRPITQQKNWWLWPLITGVCFALTWYCYIAYRPVTVGILILMTGASALWDRSLLKKLAVVWIGMVIMVVPFFLPSVRAANTARLQQVGLLSDEHLPVIIDENRTFCNMQLPLPFCSVIWNKGTFAIQTLSSRFLHTYSPEYLATKGEANELFLTVKNFGQFVMIVYPFIWLGLAELILIRRKLKMTELLVVVGLLVCPIPTILAGEPQKVRLSELLPFLILIVLYGVHRLHEWIHNLELKRAHHALVKAVVGLGAVFLFLTATTSYMVDFYTNQTIKNDFMYQSYLPKLFSLVTQKYPDQQLLVKPFFSDPTMFYAFYTNMDPAAYQKQAVLGKLEGSGFQHTVKIDAMEVWDSGFLSAACQAVATNTPTLYITDEKAQIPYAIEVEKIMSENGSLTYVHVYDALTSGKLSVMQCNDIPLEKRQAINKEVEASGLRQSLTGAQQ